MPALTLEQLNTLAVLLDSREERIRGQMDAANVARAVSTRPEAGDVADLAEQGAEQRMDDAVVDHYRAELADIAAARARIAQQAYGICLDCGESIPYLRLQAYPTAERCMPCQRRHEHTFGAAS
ncbi:hypothetical protein UB46_24230 [Burkholderiaceae bacterium 16]|nr:hypothetical protein UB46_24230 [Burkholderiaceae bacterium 16]